LKHRTSRVPTQLTEPWFHQQALKTVHINIVDLLDAVKQGTHPQRFGNAHQLAVYTVKTRRIYPKDKVKAMGPVKALMRRIL
jgi:hypothetical protein